MQIDTITTGRILHTRRTGKILVGCLIALAVVVGAIALAGWYAANNWRGWVAEPMRSFMMTAIQEVEMPDEQRLLLTTEINDLVDSFAAGNLTLEELGKIATEFAESPLLPASIVMGFYESYYRSSALTDEEKAEARKQMSRLIHGIVEETIPTTKIDDALAPISDPQGEVNIDLQTTRVRLKSPERVTPEELRELIQTMKQVADDAGIVDELIVVDFAEEFTQMIDRALGRTPRLPPAPTPAPAPQPLPPGDD